MNLTIREVFLGAWIFAIHILFVRNEAIGTNNVRSVLTIYDDSKDGSSYYCYISICIVNICSVSKIAVWYCKTKFCSFDVATLYLSIHTYTHGPLTRYVKLWVAHAPGMPRTFSPTPISKEITNKWSRHASRHVRHARAVMHAGIANPRWRGKRSRHYTGAWTTRSLTYLAWGPWINRCVIVSFRQLSVNLSKLCLSTCPRNVYLYVANINLTLVFSGY